MIEDTFVAQVEYERDSGKITLRSQSDPSYFAEVKLSALTKIVCTVKETSCVVQLYKAKPSAPPVQETTLSIKREKDTSEVRMTHGGNAETHIQIPGSWVPELTTYCEEPTQWRITFGKP